MNALSCIIYYGQAVLGKSKLFNGIVKAFYVATLVPSIEYYLKNKHPQLKKMLIRNSLNQATFNAFFSDIDTFLVIENNSDSCELIKSFLALKRFFVILDLPEIYTEEEYLRMEDLKIKPEWHLIDFCWNIRKINWCYQSLLQNSNKLNSAKMNRAINASFKKILKEGVTNQQASYSLKNFKYIDQIFPIDSNQPRVCYSSKFTATIGNPKIILDLSLSQYVFLNSLMPGEVVDETIKNKVSTFFMQNKSALLLHELYLSRSALRIKKAQGVDYTEHLKWCSVLEEHLARTFKARKLDEFVQD